MLGPELMLALALITVQERWEDRRSAHDAVAYVVAEAMPHSDYGSLEWISFGAGAGNGVYWHLIGPREAPDIRLPGVFRRTGWVESRGPQISLAACGDSDRVHSLAVRSRDWNYEAVLAALASRDVTAIETYRRGRADRREFEAGADTAQDGLTSSGPPRYMEWRLTRSRHAPAVLSAEFRCTRPGTRSAQRCWTNWTVVFREDFTGRGGDPVPLEHCVLPGRE